MKKQQLITTCLTFAVCALAMLQPASADNDIVLNEFEAGDYGQWKPEGKAFGTAPANGTLHGQMEVRGFQGKGLVNSFLGDDEPTGKLTSPEPTIERDNIKFLIWASAFNSLAAVPTSHDRSGADRHRITIPTLDLTGEADPADLKRHVVVAGGVDGEDWQHPHMLLMPDGKTIFAVWTQGHGGTCGYLKRSDDGGHTWTQSLEVPDNWKSAKNCPTIHRLVDPQGKVRLFVFAQNNQGEFVRSLSEDEGRTWSPMESAGFRGVVPPMTVLPVDGGKRILTWTHESRNILNVLQCESTDGGLTWSQQTQPIDKRQFPNSFPCEPEVLRSPDGKQLLMLMRENNRRFHSLYSVSDDEGKAWAKPRELPASLTGDRHTALSAEEGRLVVMFRDRRPVPKSEANGDKGGQPVWGSGKTTVWVGRYEDIVNGHEGKYLVRVLGYGGYGKLERLPDGTILGLTYCRYPSESKNRSSIVSTRFKLGETDALLTQRRAADTAAKQRQTGKDAQEKLAEDE